MKRGTAKRCCKGCCCKSVQCRGIIVKEHVPETYKLGKAQKTGMKTVRVLQVLGGTSLGGAESRVMDSYRHMDRNRIQFDFAIHTGEKGF